MNDTHIEGMSFLRDIEGDFFRFDEAAYEIVGSATGRRMTLGDAVRIRVKRADLQKRQLDFELVLPDLPRRGSSAGRTKRTAGPAVSRSTRRKGR